MDRWTSGSYIIITLKNKDFLKLEKIPLTSLKSTISLSIKKTTSTIRKRDRKRWLNKLKKLAKENKIGRRSTWLNGLRKRFSIKKLNIKKSRNSKSKEIRINKVTSPVQRRKRNRKISRVSTRVEWREGRKAGRRREFCRRRRNPQYFVRLITKPEWSSISNSFCNYFRGPSFLYCILSLPARE